jgi:P27 family predicted phage terminase small subunit
LRQARLQLEVKMGQRGPAPKPAELKALEGGRGHRPINLDQTFRPEVGLPDMPRWLSKEGRKAWKRLTPELLHYNLLSKVDRDALGMLCQTIGRLEQIEQALAGRAKLLEGEGKEAAAAFLDATPKGMAIQHPYYQILNREQAKLNSLLAEFGLTPAQRARVTTAIRVQATLFDANADKPATPPKDPTAPKGFADFQ